MRNCIAKSICYMAPTPTHYLSPYWLWLTAFVGLNLLQSAFTNRCLATTIFPAIGMKDTGN